MNPLKGVGIGAGYFSHYQYEAWQRIPEVTITALCNRSLERGREAAQRFGIKSVYGIGVIDEMLDQEQPDFIDIITPPETHLDIVKRAVDRGIAIICQKPLAPTLEECREIVNLAREAKVRLLVHENWRWQPWYREIRRQLDKGEIGELYSIAVKMRMGDGWPEDAYLSRQPFFRHYPRLLIYETGVHFLDTFRYLGGEISAIYARLQRRNPNISGEDAGQVVATFASGATALLDASRYNESDAADPRYTFGTVRVDGSKGHLELDAEGTLTRKHLGQPAEIIDYPHEHTGFAGDCVYALQRHFTDCMLSGQPFESTGEDYLKTIALVDACYQSNQSGQSVQIT